MFLMAFSWVLQYFKKLGSDKKQGVVFEMQKKVEQRKITDFLFFLVHQIMKIFSFRAFGPEKGQK